MKNLKFKKLDNIAVLTVNRPQALNALNLETLEELRNCLTSQQDIRVLILTGAEKSFIAGADIKEMQAMNPQQIIEFCQRGQDVANLFETSPFVTIAAVNGYALGGGLEMALACDFIYASQKAKLGLPEVSLGVIPGFGGTQRLARAAGTRRAKEMIMSGQHISAHEALMYGIVNKVCEPESLLQECEKIAKTITGHSYEAIKRAKKAINEGSFELETQLFAECFGTKEREEAMSKWR